MLPDNLLVPALNMMLLSVVVALLTLLAASCMRSMVRRHAVLVTGLVACLALPLPVAIGWSLSLGRLPDLAVRAAVPPPMIDAIDSTDAIAPAAPVMTAESVAQAPAAVRENDDDAAAPPHIDAAAAETSAAIDDRAGGDPVRTDTSPVFAPEPTSWRDHVRRLGAAAIIVWCAGTLIMAVRLGIGLVRVRRLLRLCAPCDDACVNRTIRDVATQLGIDPAPKVLHAAAVPAPVVVGLFRPAIILSRDAASLLTHEQLRAVLMHECAHIRRGDHRIVALQAAAGVIYWWNPLMHLISRSIARVRELICDDAVIVSGGTSRPYAQSIVMLAERACAVPQPLSKLGISMSSAGELEQRVRRILSSVVRESHVRASAPLRVSVVSIATAAVIGLLACQFPAAEGLGAEAAPVVQAAHADESRPAPALSPESENRAVIVVTDIDRSPIEGAWVAVRFESEHHYLPPILTDAEGRAEHDYPADERIQDLIVWKDREGIAHAGFRRAEDQRMNLRANLPEFPRDRSFRVTLRGASPLTVRVEDPEGAPVTSVMVRPLFVSGMDSSAGIGFVESLAAQTDDDGVVTFHWRNTSAAEIAVQIRPQDQVHALKSMERLVPGDGADPAVALVTVQRLVPLTGRILGGDGTPVSGVRVEATGYHAQPITAHFDAVSDEAGRYTLRVDPNRAYIVVPRDARWAADPQSPIVVFPDARVDDIDFVVRPATRVRGRLVHRTTGLPISDHPVTIYRSGEIVMAQRDLGLVLGPQEDDGAIELAVGPIHATSGADGAFDMALGDGRYRVLWPISDPPIEFVVAGEEVIDLRVESVRSGLLEFMGRVVIEAGGAPAEGVTVTGQPRAIGRRGWHAVTDADGTFHVQREDHPAFIHGITGDRQRVGVALSSAVDEPFELPLVASGTVHGRIVREADGTPLAGERLAYQIVLPDDPNWVGQRPFYGGMVTDDDGRFELKGLIPGWTYRISYARPPRSFIAFNVVVEPGEVRDLQTLRRDTPQSRLLFYGPPVHGEPQRDWHDLNGSPVAVRTSRTPLLSLQDLSSARLTEQMVTVGGTSEARSVVMLTIDPNARGDLLDRAAEFAQPPWTMVVTLDGRVVASPIVHPPLNLGALREFPLSLTDEEDVRVLLELIGAEAEARD